MGRKTIRLELNNQLSTQYNYGKADTNWTADLVFNYEVVINYWCVINMEGIANLAFRRL